MFKSFFQKIRILEYCDFKVNFVLILNFFRNAQNVIAAGFGKKKRSISTPDDIGNILKRTIEDDQIDVLKVQK